MLRQENTQAFIVFSVIFHFMHFMCYSGNTERLQSKMSALRCDSNLLNTLCFVFYFSFSDFLIFLQISTNFIVNVTLKVSA